MNESFLNETYYALYQFSGDLFAACIADGMTLDEAVDELHDALGSYPEYIFKIVKVSREIIE
jgi:hypothetical protein